MSFFAGCGGLDLGFEQAGFRVVWANEFEPSVRDTYVRNHPDTLFVLNDICKVSPKDIPDCDGFIGGPPCQSWSIAGKQRGLDDQRGQLFLTYIDLIRTKSPKFFLIENVKGLLDAKFKMVFEDFLLRLETAGYNVQWELLDAADYGVPQNRERVFIIGFRKDLDISFRFPAPTYISPKSLNEAIGDITEEPRSFFKEKIKSANSIRPNHDVYTGCYGSYYRRGNRRRPWDRASFTICATGENIPLHPSSPKMIYFGHENWNFQENAMSGYRRLSVRECARIQSFPDDFIFEGSNILAQYKMVGNAVPPRLGKAIAESILAAIKKVEIQHKDKDSSKEKSTEICALVGYFKNEKHYNLIKRNLLYYVRSDGRKGSMFKEDCSMKPKYLLLHNKDRAEIYELNTEEPILADASFLKSLGFNTSGRIYLCFQLKSAQQFCIQELGGSVKLQHSRKYYSPYFTTINNIAVKDL